MISCHPIKFLSFFHGASVKMRVLKIECPSVVPSVDPSVDPSVEGFILIMNSNFDSDNSIC